MLCVPTASFDSEKNSVRRGQRDVLEEPPPLHAILHDENGYAGSVGSVHQLPLSLNCSEAQKWSPIHTCMHSLTHTQICALSLSLSLSVDLLSPHSAAWKESQ